jgi:hypothetical protein
MGRTLRVGVVLLLAALFATDPLTGQQNGGSDRAKPRIEQGSSSPLSPGSPISFALFQEDFEDGKPVVVSLRIRNILGQLVAVPAAVDHPDGGIGVENLVYTSPGLKEAVWNGNDRSGHPVAAGIYLLELVVNGERAPPLRIVVAD